MHYAASFQARRFHRAAFVLFSTVATLLCQACGGPAALPGPGIRPVHEGQEQFVRLEGRPRDDRPGGFAHPLRLAPAEWTRILSGIRIQSRKDSFLFTTAKEPPAEALAPDEVAYLGTTLSQAFAKARPDEWVEFGLSRVTASGVNEITTGGWFAEGDRLHLVLANYRHAATKAGVRERVWQNPLEPAAAPFYEVVEGEYLSVQKRAGGLLGLWANAGPEIVIDYKALLRVSTAGAPPRRPFAPSAPPQAQTSTGAAVNQPPPLPEPSRPSMEAVEEQLRTLKRLRDEGLISDEDYRAKKKELLDRF